MTKVSSASSSGLSSPAAAILNVKRENNKEQSNTLTKSTQSLNNHQNEAKNNNIIEKTSEETLTNTVSESTPNLSIEKTCQSTTITSFSSAAVNVNSSSSSLAANTITIPAQTNPKTNKIRIGNETLIEIERGKLGLGLSIVGGTDTHIPAVIIHDIYENGAAYKDKRLAIGDQILRVNNIDLRNVTHDEALNILRQTSDNVQLLVLRNYDTSLNDELGSNVEDSKFDIFTVELYKKFGKGLGFSIVGRRDGYGVFISDIIVGGCAAKDGRLMVGDLILDVNGNDIRQAPYNEVAYLLKTLPPQTKVLLKIGRLKSNSSKSSSRKNSTTNSTAVILAASTTNHADDACKNNVNKKSPSKSLN